MPQRNPSAEIPLSKALALGLTAGLGAGYLEVAVQALRKQLHGTQTFQSTELIWMAPVADAAIFVVAIAVTALVQRARGRPIGRAAVTSVCLALAGVTLLWMASRLHPAAAVLLAIGLATVIGRFAARWTGRLDRAVAWLASGLALATGGIALARFADRTITERRDLEQLTAAPGMPNVLLIIWDTVRAANLSLYGYSRPTSPRLAAFARRGARFERAISPASWTRPAHASIFTGREAPALSADWLVPLDGEYPTLAEYLRSLGYATGGFSANVWFAGHESGFGRGFIRFRDYPISISQIAVSSTIGKSIHRWYSARRDLPDNMPARQWAPDIGRELVDWIDAAGSKPWFAFLNFYDAHAPFIPPEPYRHRFGQTGADEVTHLPERARADLPIDSSRVAGAIAAYDGAIQWLDDETGKLLDAVEARGALRNTIVVIASDHGEEFYEHGLPDHGNSLYRRSVHVPLVMVAPGRIPEGAAVATPVTTRSIAATIADLVGRRGDAPFPGPSLATTWQAPRDSVVQPIILSEVRFAKGLPAWYPVSKGDLLSVFDGRLRSISVADRFEVFDFDADPDERHDLVGSVGDSAAIARLRAITDSVMRARRSAR